MLGGQLYRGATGGAGEIGFMQGSGDDLVRRVRRENSGGFQRYAGPAQIVPLARRFGLGGKTAAAVVAAAAKADAEKGTTRGGEFLDELAMRFAGGLASIIAVIDPAMVVLSGGTAAAGGEALRGRIQAQLRELAMAHPDVVFAPSPATPSSRAVWGPRSSWPERPSSPPVEPHRPGTERPRPQRTRRHPRCTLHGIPSSP